MKSGLTRRAWDMTHKLPEVSVTALQEERPCCVRNGH